MFVKCPLCCNNTLDFVILILFQPLLLKDFGVCCMCATIIILKTLCVMYREVTALVYSEKCY